MRRVLVTGIGLLTPLGTGVDETWHGLTHGRSAIGMLTGYDPRTLRTRIGAELAGFDPLKYTTRRSLRMMGREDEFAIAATTLALRDAGRYQDSPPSLGPCAGLFLGGDKELGRAEALATGILAASRDGVGDHRRLGELASSTIPPLFYVAGLQAAALFHISQMFDVRGVNAYFAGTADAGAAAIGRAMRSIRRGECDLAIAGGFADGASWWSMSKMDGLGVLSDDNASGTHAYRPFDLGRSGSVMGSGAVMLVLEAAETARGRPYAELRGAGFGGDGSASLTPDPAGRGLANAIRSALRDADLAPDAIGYVAAHGCATWQGDLTEALAIHATLGPAVPISSVKPQTGHLLAAAGALNVAVAALALHTGTLPSTLTLREPDPKCEVRHVMAGDRLDVNGRTGVLALARGLTGGQVALALAPAGTAPQVADGEAA